jgi:hypothetical protein
MPAFGWEDSPESIWGLVSFIRRLPKLTPEEIKQLQAVTGSYRQLQAVTGSYRQLQEMAEGGKTEKEETRGAQPESARSKEKRAPKPNSHGPGTKPHSL